VPIKAGPSHIKFQATGCDYFASAKRKSYKPPGEIIDRNDVWKVWKLDSCVKQVARPQFGFQRVSPLGKTQSQNPEASSKRDWQLPEEEEEEMP